MIAPRFALVAATLATSLLVVADSGQTRTAPAPASPLVVTSSWLAEHIKDPDLVLLHVGDRAQYDTAHIPGARFVSQNDVAVTSHDHDNGLMLEMPSADTLKAQLERLGISDKSRIVIYYGRDWISPTTRVVFTLDYAGLGDRTSLLDGGMQDWIATGHAVTREVSPARVGSLSPLKVRPLIVDAAWVKNHLGARGYSFVDGRAASFYDGVEATGPRKGHIPGARSVPFTEIADDRLRVKSVAELGALFTKAGVQPGDTIVGYCHIGQQATAMLFAARLLGHPVRLFDGSMQEWSRRTDLPIETASASK